MLDIIMDRLYQPYIKQRAQIVEHAFALNHCRGFRYKGFKTSLRATPITNEAAEYLDPLVQELQPIFDEQARIHAWLLRISNKLYVADSVMALLPKELTNGVTFSVYKEADQKVLNRAKKDLELTLIRKRLLLRTML